MEKLERALFLIPFVIGLMELVKSLFTEEGYKKIKRFMGLVSIFMGIVVAYGYVGAMSITDMNNYLIIFGGVIVGLSASGLYEVSKNTISKPKQDVPTV